MGDVRTNLCQIEYKITYFIETGRLSSSWCVASLHVLANADELEACKLQGCLMKNDYQQSRCENIIDELYICCGRHYNKTQQKIDSCPIESVLHRKLKDRGLGDKV
ncbi:hypothetical protein E3P77_04051 [Wallemia ichthyophaga]|nr:hypothetical protein E3P77_04051 [Wallemia ichthyophaga]